MSAGAILAWVAVAGCLAALCALLSLLCAEPEPQEVDDWDKTKENLK